MYTVGIWSRTVARTALGPRGRGWACVTRNGRAYAPITRDCARARDHSRLAVTSAAAVAVRISSRRDAPEPTLKLQPRARFAA